MSGAAAFFPAAFALSALLWPTTTLPQQRLPGPPRGIVVGDTVQVVAGRYEAGAVHRLLFGAGWRDLWATPIRVPLLDLEATAGGLRPVERGGGFQTRSLELASADGRDFRFRSVDKDPSQTLPAGLRLPGIVSLFRDQTSALHPAGALVAASLAEAAGIPHVISHLVVMPDDPALGPFRAEFGGMLGLLVERPAPGPDGEPTLFGFRSVVDTDGLLPGLHPSRDRIDARRYLAARLLDLYLNDWDRHEGNWLWGTRDPSAPRRWIAIPQDRDQVFASYEGIVPWLVRGFVPKLLPFTGEYRLRALTINARDLDRRILSALAPARAGVAIDRCGGRVGAPADVGPVLPALPRGAHREAAEAPDTAAGGSAGVGPLANGRRGPSLTAGAPVGSRPSRSRRSSRCPSRRSRRR